MKSKILLFITILCLTSCKLISLGQDQTRSLSSGPVIGTIGVLQEDIITSKFVQAGLPQLDEKIKLMMEYSLFSKRSLRKFNSGVIKEEQKLKIIDSIELRPGYFKIGISDKVGLIKTLNQEKNRGLKDYLEVTKNNQILTAMEIYFPPEITALLEDATEVYLVNNKKSSYSLELLNKDGSTRLINFDEGHSFGYSFMAFCWNENYKHKADIAAFRNLNTSCPGSTHKNPDKVYSKDIFETLN